MISKTSRLSFPVVQGMRVDRSANNDNHRADDQRQCCNVQRQLGSLFTHSPDSINQWIKVRQWEIGGIGLDEFPILKEPCAGWNAKPQAV